MQMKLFYASNTKQIKEIEPQVNEFLESIALTAKVFAVNTAAMARSEGGFATLAITVWFERR